MGSIWISSVVCVSRHNMCVQEWDNRYQCDEQVNIMLTARVCAIIAREKHENRIKIHITFNTRLFRVASVHFTLYCPMNSFNVSSNFLILNLSWIFDTQNDTQFGGKFIHIFGVLCCCYCHDTHTVPQMVWRHGKVKTDFSMQYCCQCQLVCYYCLFDSAVLMCYFTIFCGFYRKTITTKSTEWLRKWLFEWFWIDNDMECHSWVILCVFVDCFCTSLIDKRDAILHVHFRFCVCVHK